MVSNVTSLTGKGLRDWLIQRFTAIVLGIYAISMIAFWFSHTPMDYSSWHHFYACTWIKVLNLVVLLSLVLHAWIGLWTITTDYIKCTRLRLTIQALICLILLGLFFWGILVFCGV
jgi:succinate dehydrogenase / fumarate reductase membrane anchor subunit